MKNMHEPKAKKSLGQNFLQDKNIARKIVKAIQIGPSDQIIEIGPGPGMLTGFILDAGPAELTLIEKDNYLAQNRSDEAALQLVPVTVLNMDAMKVDWRSYTAPCKVCGNLPYNVASPLMWDIVSRATGLTRAVFMIQKEVGERLCAKPSTSAYGALSIWVQSFCNVELQFLVPPQVFKPCPKIYSAVVSFAPLPAAERPQKPEVLSYLLKMFFQQRRKQLGGILRAHGYDTSALEVHGINPMDRPENLSVAQYKALAQIFLIK